jgi:hypothetical protein
MEKEQGETRKTGGISRKELFLATIDKRKVALPDY